MSKKDFNTFELNVCFSSAVTSKSEISVEKIISTWILEAERLFDDKPALNIKPEFIHGVKGVSANLSFDKDKDLRKFMDDNFDTIVGKDKTDGVFQVLVVDSVSSEKKGLNGSAFFPHCVTPFGRKHGIVMDIDALPTSFAHELGHVFSLKHTFENYVGLKDNCNKDFPKGDPGQGGTRVGNRINLMDYKRDADDQVVMNECQRERAAHQRRMYMTKDGETNYRDLKGLR